MNDAPKLNQYFATLPANDLPTQLVDRVTKFDQYIANSGRLGVWQKSYSLYNQGIYKDAQLNRMGEQGEYTEMYVNQFRNILIHILNMTTQQRPAFDARASNTDHKSQAQTIVGNGVLDYYNRVKGMDEIAKTAVDDVLQFADGYVYQGWDFSLGDPVMPDLANGTIKKQGDVFHKNFVPVNVIFDFISGLMDGSREWYILRDFQNKWNLAKRYPELADKILAASQSSETWQNFKLGTEFQEDSDMIPVYIFIHDRTEAVPNGRMFTYIAKDCWLLDTTLPEFYKKLPVYRLCASKQRGSGFGYSVAFDLAPIQEAINGLYSIIITNQSTFGVQNILVPNGANLTSQALTDGLNVIGYNAAGPDGSRGEPKALQLLSTAPEIFEFLQRLESVMEVISGVNSVARGQPEESLKSGSALALVQSMAIQFISGLQQSYASLLEDLGTGLINILQKNATTPRLIEIAGKSNKSYMQEFKGSDIDSINRVTVDLGNPLSRTTAGKVNMADNLLNAGMIENPQQYLQVLTTGKLEPLYEGKQAELMLIRAENEELEDGKPVSAIAVDNHLLHIEEHKTVIASPQARVDGNVINSTMSHIMEHLNLWRTTDPMLLAALGQQPPPQPAMPGQEGANGETMAAGNPTQKTAEKVKQPNLPKNPLEKQTATVTGGV